MAVLQVKNIEKHFGPSAVLWAYSAEILFLNLQLRKICGFSGVAFSQVGSQRATALSRTDPFS